MHTSGSPAAGHLAQLALDVGLGVVEGLAAYVPLGHRHPLGVALYGDHALRAEQHRRAGRHLPDPAATPHGDHVAGLHPAHVRAHPACGRRVGGEKGRLVG